MTFAEIVLGGPFHQTSRTYRAAASETGTQSHEGSPSIGARPGQLDTQETESRHSSLHNLQDSGNRFPLQVVQEACLLRYFIDELSHWVMSLIMYMISSLTWF
jgi:hypothetical protein